MSESNFINSKDEADSPGDKRNSQPIIATLIRVTRPDLLIGIAVGISLVIIGNTTFAFGLGWYVLVGLLAFATTLCFGATLGFVIFKHYSDEVKDKAVAGGEALGEMACRVVSGFVAIRDISATAEDFSKLKDDIQAVQPVALASIKAIFGLIGRVLAFGRLAAVLGAAISFAIFLTTFMQVEKLELQNQLLETSNHLQEASRRILLVEETQNLLSDLVPYNDSDTNQPLDVDLIDRIVNLTVGLRPYRILEYRSDDIYKSVGQVTGEGPQDSLSQRPLSTERGRLLLRILKLKISNRKALAEARPDFTHSDLRDMRIGQLDFSHLVLSYSDFRNVEGMAPQFENAQLAFADFSGAELLGANFGKAKEPVSSIRRQRADLRFSKFVSARLNNANFTAADLTNSDFSDAVLFGADFSKASLDNANLSGAAIWQADDEQQWEEAVKMFETLLTALPEKERSNWTLRKEDPGATHKYLGDSNDNTKYAIIRAK